MFGIVGSCSFQMSRAWLLFSLTLFLNKGIETATFRIQQPPLNIFLHLCSIMLKTNKWKQQQQQIYFKSRERTMTLHELCLYLNSLASLFLTILYCSQVTTALHFWIPWECEKWVELQLFPLVYSALFSSVNLPGCSGGVLSSGKLFLGLLLHCKYLEDTLDPCILLRPRNARCLLFP